MKVFVDESGDAGFKIAGNSTRYFVIASVIFRDDMEADKTTVRIDLLRQQRHTPTLEYHFAKNNTETRVAFLRAVQPYDFQAVAFVVDKRRLSSQDYKDGAAFYRSVCGTAFERMRHLLQDANVQFDEREGRHFKQSLASYLRGKINSPGATHIKKVGIRKSSADNLIQLADMIAGSVARSFEEEDEKYWELIRHKLEVIVWPE